MISTPRMNVEHENYLEHIPVCITVDTRIYVVKWWNTSCKRHAITRLTTSSLEHAGIVDVPSTSDSP